MNWKRVSQTLREASGQILENGGSQQAVDVLMALAAAFDKGAPLPDTAWEPKPAHFIEWTTLPWGKPTKDDPLGQRGYFGWKLISRGKRYGQVIVLADDNGKSFDEQVEDAKPAMLESAFKVVAELAAKHE